MTERGLTRLQIAELAGGASPAAEDWSSAEPPRIMRVSAIEGAGPDSLVFAEDEPTLAEAIASSAGLILAKVSNRANDGRVLGVPDPRYAFALSARELSRQGENSTTSRVHPSAVVDATAVIGARVRIGAGTVIEADVRLGDDVSVGSNAVIAQGVIVGDRVVVQSGAVLGSVGFGYVRHQQTGEYLLFPQQGTLVIEDDVEIGANATIDRGALGETRIGRGTKLDNMVHIAHNCQIGKNVIIAAQSGISGSCVLDDGVIIAGQAGLSEHCHLGPGVILGGGSGVYRGKTLTGPGEVYAGTPAEPLRDHLRALARLRRLR